MKTTMVQIKTDIEFCEKLRLVTDCNTNSKAFMSAAKLYPILISQIDDLKGINSSLIYRVQELEGIIHSLTFAAQQIVDVSNSGDRA